MSTVAAILVSALLPCAASAAPDAKDAVNSIKSHKYEIKPLPYRDEGRRDPFASLVPLRAVRQRDEWKVRIQSLELSSVIMGKKRVAIFNEVHGPRYSYILVNGTLIGPDHRPIPGIAGTIERTTMRGSYRVILKQGGERVEYTLGNWNLEDLKAARRDPRSGRAASGSGKTDKKKTSEGGDRK